MPSNSMKCAEIISCVSASLFVNIHSNWICQSLKMSHTYNTYIFRDCIFWQTNMCQQLFTATRVKYICGCWWVFTAARLCVKTRVKINDGAITYRPCSSCGSLMGFIQCSNIKHTQSGTMLIFLLHLLLLYSSTTAQHSPNSLWIWKFCSFLRQPSSSLTLL